MALHEIALFQTAQASVNLSKLKSCIFDCATHSINIPMLILFLNSNREEINSTFGHRCNFLKFQKTPQHCLFQIAQSFSFNCKFFFSLFYFFSSIRCTFDFQVFFSFFLFKLKLSLWQLFFSLSICFCQTPTRDSFSFNVATIFVVLIAKVEGF